MALTWLVEIDGPTRFEGEATGGRWFAVGRPPHESDVGFQQGAIVQRLFAALRA